MIQRTILQTQTSLFDLCQATKSDVTKWFVILLEVELSA
jgi:hypothetical protein